MQNPFKKKKELVIRDVRNVTRYFKKLGVEVNEEDVLKEIKEK